VRLRGWRWEWIGAPIARLRARRRLRRLRRLGRAIIYVSGYPQDLPPPARLLLERLKADDELLVFSDHHPMWMNYPTLREMLRASDAMLAFAGPVWLLATCTLVETTIADGTLGLDRTARPLKQPIPVLVYPICPREEWPEWLANYSRHQGHTVLALDATAAELEVRATVLTGASATRSETLEPG
jgi:hypothetical protein